MIRHRDVSQLTTAELERVNNPSREQLSAVAVFNPAGTTRTGDADVLTGWHAASTGAEPAGTTTVLKLRHIGLDGSPRVRLSPWPGVEPRPVRLLMSLDLAGGSGAPAAEPPG